MSYYLFIFRKRFVLLPSQLQFLFGGSMLVKEKDPSLPFFCHEIKLQYMTVKVIKMMMQDYSANS